MLLGIFEHRAIVVLCAPERHQSMLWLWFLLFLLITSAWTKGFQEDNDDHDAFWAGYHDRIFDLWGEDNQNCRHSIWCGVQMPNVSYFRFDPPTNKTKWQLSVIAARDGEQILLQRSLKHHSDHKNFLDGDTNFRRQHDMGDIFVDKYKDLSQLIGEEVKVKDSIYTLFPLYKLYTLYALYTPTYTVIQCNGLFGEDGSSINRSRLVPQLLYRLFTRNAMTAAMIALDGRGP